MNVYGWKRERECVVCIHSLIAVKVSALNMQRLLWLVIEVSLQSTSGRSLRQCSDGVICVGIGGLVSK